ncbi:MAG: YitT family protein [Mycoplasmoidaceae bacterium]
MKTALDSRTKKILNNIYYEENKKKTEKASLKFSGLKFSGLYGNIKFKYKIIICVFSALLMGMITLLFIQNSGLYSPGLSGLSQGIARFIGVLLHKFYNWNGNQNKENVIYIVIRVLFYGLSILINIPILIFAYLKVGKQFALLTITYVIVSNIFPLSLSFIKNIGNLHIFGEVKSSLYKDLPSESYVFLTWDKQDSSRVISLLFYALGYSFCAGIPLTLSFVIGSSTGGFDVVAIYIMKIKKKQLGTIFLINNLLILVIASSLGTFASLRLLEISGKSHNIVIEDFFSPNFSSSIILVALLGVIINKMYPRFKMVAINIISPRSIELDQKAFGGEYDHKRLVSYVIGGYKKEAQEVIVIYCFIFEANELISRVKSIYPGAFIVVGQSISIDGKISYKSFLS